MYDEPITMKSVENLPRVEFELCDFLKIAGFLLDCQLRYDAIGAKYVSDMRALESRTGRRC